MRHTLVLAPAITADDVREALRVCYDSDLPVNIVDLGVLEAITLTPDPDAPGPAPRFHANITLLPRTDEEPRLAMLQAQVENRLAGLYPISRSTVTFADAPTWSADRMSDAARTQLGLSRLANSGLIQIQL